MINNEYAHRAHTHIDTYTPPTYNISHPTAHTMNGTNMFSSKFEIRVTIQSDKEVNKCVANRKHLMWDF